MSANEKLPEKSGEEVKEYKLYINGRERMERVGRCPSEERRQKHPLYINVHDNNSDYPDNRELFV